MLAPTTGRGAISLAGAVRFSVVNASGQDLLDDTGSLSLAWRWPAGLFTRTELLLVIWRHPVIDVMSVILQVFFKLTKGRRWSESPIPTT